MHNNRTLTNNGGFAQFTWHQDDTVGTRMKAAGYRTAWVGKYLNGYTNGAYHGPGWDEWRALVDPYSYYMYGFRISRAVDRPFATAATVDTYNGGSTATSANNYQTDVLTTIGVNFIDDAVATGRTPFFLVEMPLAPHVEALPGVSIGSQDDMRRLRVRPAPRHTGTLRAGNDSTPLRASLGLPHGSSPAFNEADVSDKPAWLRTGSTAWGSLDSADVAAVTRQHLDRLESMLAVDDMVGAIWGRLVAHGIEDETVFVFSSDNGYMLGEHRLSNKMFPYEESIRVPLAISCNAPTGTTEARLASNIDLAPTLLDFAGASWDVDGRSLRPIVEGTPPPTWRSRVLVEHWYDNKTPFPFQELPDMAMVRTSGADSVPSAAYVGYYGFVGTLDQSRTATENEQYDLLTDPAELQSVVTNASYAP